MAKKKMVVKNNSSRGGYFIRRVLAFGIDWYLSGVLANIAISLCYGFSIKDRLRYSIILTE